MSWFSDLTSKAEAMLVRLDQDAAQALQKPENILTKAGLLDRATSVLETNRETTPILERYHEEDDSIVTDIEDDYVSTEVNANLKNSQIDEHSSTSMMTSSTEMVVEATSHSNEAASSASTDIQQVNQLPGHPTRDHNQNIHAIKETLTPEVPNAESSRQARKFKFQTSKLRRPLLDRQASSTAETPHKLDNGYNDRAMRVEATLGADDIRASINRSLREYSLTTSPFSPRGSNNQTTSTSHFDDQPNLIRPMDRESDKRSSNDRLQNSPSFSINFPDNGGSSGDIADQIFMQSAMKRKSNFNLHKVLNKLAGNSGQSQAIIGDKTKIKLRRAHMRLASYMRRLNYYFMAYPTMKYWAIGYLVLLQLLVIYVLFFYKSTSSSSYLAAQVKQQQEELISEWRSESFQSNGAKIISPKDLHSNSLL